MLQDIRAPALICEGGRQQQAESYLSPCLQTALSLSAGTFLPVRTYSLFVQQLFHSHILTLLALLVEEDDEGDGGEIKLLLQVAPLGAGDVDVLALDVVGFEERLAMLWCVVGDVEVLYGLVLVGLHLVAHVEHLCTAGAARHFPEVNKEHVALVRLDDALEDAVALGHRLLLHHLQFVLLHIVAVGQYASTNQIGMGDDGHGSGHIVSSLVILVFVPFESAEDATKLAHLRSEIGGADVQFVVQFVHHVSSELAAEDVLLLCYGLGNLWGEKGSILFG